MTSRPRRQVVMMTNTPAPTASGNQPPCGTFSIAEPKNARSMAKKKPVAKMHSHSG